MKDVKLFPGIAFLQRHSYVSLNGLWISPREINARLAEFVESLLSIDSLNSISRAGPCVLVRVCDKFYAVCTRHQLLERDAEWVGLNIADERVIQTSAGLLTVQGQESDLVRDLAIFDFTEVVADGSIETKQFFALEAANVIAHGDDVTALLAFGYLDQEQSVEIDFSDKYPEEYRTISLHQRLRPLTCIYAGVGCDPTAFSFKIVDKMNCSYSGLSGGPLFAIVKDGRLSFKVVFAGVVTHACNGLGWGIKGDTIHRYLLAAAHMDRQQA